MKATDLVSVLTDLSELFRAGGATQSAKDVELLSGRIRAEGNKSATDAIAELESELFPPAGPKTAAEFTKALKDAGMDAKKFDDVFGRLTDSGLRKADVVNILKGYVGAHAVARTKSDALDGIQRHFTQLLYDANAQRQAASTPW